MVDGNVISGDEFDRSSLSTGVNMESGGDDNTGSGGSGGKLGTDGLQFTRDVFSTQKDNSQVFYYQDGPELTFKYEKGSDVATTYVRLVSKTSTGEDVGDFDNVTTSDPAQEHAIFFQGDSVLLNTKNSKLVNQLASSTDNLWALKMGWERSGARNESTSPYFAFVGGQDANKASELQGEIDKITEGKNGSNGDFKSNDDSGTTRVGPGSSSTDMPGSSQTDASSSKSAHKSGGLAPGAIAGIVVGAVVGLAAIGLLAWFLLRRKRKTKAISHTGPEDGPDDSNAYIAEKDSQAQSPQSPYADDHSQHHSHEQTQPRSGPDATGTAAAAAAATSTDRAIPSASSENVAGDPGYRNASGAQTPQGVAHNVVHLVEEGMTADDIARLEEEERQLDAEIERAGQH